MTTSTQISSSISLTPSKSYRCYTSPSPTPSYSSTSSSRSRSRSTSSLSRFSPYPKVKVERSEEEDKVACKLRDIGLEIPKARSTSPYEELATAKPQFIHYKPQSHLAHRRAYSMSQVSYGYFILPSSSPSTPKEESRPQTVKRHIRAHSTSASPLPNPFQGFARPMITPSPRSIPSERVNSAAPKPSDKTADSSSRRLILVNPTIAHHLVHGGMVGIRSVDGKKSFKICLPHLGGVQLVRSAAAAAY
ncbi:uncharacterized protein IL334_003935 [Kwoniella shivajii]|uniref:Uncharacterized protein n=1 Tax=Kwoniella shivajii TaxID=564305 RepID=A0ABZ1CYY9_9TREE|nr:hypothetical protein IL334_003935 [Kwoniella shivajii]